MVGGYGWWGGAPEPPIDEPLLLIPYSKFIQIVEPNNSKSLIYHNLNMKSLTIYEQNLFNNDS